METWNKYRISARAVGTFRPSYQGWKRVRSLGLPPDVVSLLDLPIRDGNLIKSNSISTAGILLDLPIRDGNVHVHRHVLSPPLLLDLPIRDGNNVATVSND